MISRARNIFCRFGIILRPWLCVVAYLWILELLSVYGTDFEPVMDGIADASAILWTLNLWVAVVAALVSLTTQFLPPLSVRRTNEFVCRVVCLLVSAFYLMRWLTRWSSLIGNAYAVLYVLILLSAGLYFLTRRRRIRSPRAGADDLPSWQDCFGYAVLPVLIASVVVLGIRVAEVLYARHDIPTVFSESLAANPRAAASSPNVIVIVSDSLRAQSLSLYNSDGVATPMIDQFGKSSSVYLATHANATNTAPSLTTLLTGRDLIHHGRLYRDLPAIPSEKNLLRILRSQGYTTAAVTSNYDASFVSLGLSSELTQPENFEFQFVTLWWLRDLGIYPTRLGGRMYSDLRLVFPWLGFPERTSPSGKLDDTLSRARQMITHLRQPFFLFIHIHEPHESNTLPSWSRLISELVGSRKNGVEPYKHYDIARQPEVDAYRAEYLDSVRGVDAGLGQFLDDLRRQAWFDRSLVILTGDHGDSFKRGYLYHGAELYENSTWVPLVIRFPGQKSGARVSGLTQTTDIAPTILNTVGLTIPHWMDGQALDRELSPAPVATMAINYELAGDKFPYALPTTKLAIWWNRFKLIADCYSPLVELYDLVNDPAEEFNLAERERETTRNLKVRLKQHLAKQLGPLRLVCENL
jgi:arylsulfatase A-like enzyme